MKSFNKRIIGRPEFQAAFAGTIIMGFFLASLPVAYAHHGWAEFDQSKEITLTGTVTDPSFEYPHASMILLTGDEEWHIVMAPPRRLNRMGVSGENLLEGTTVTVVGHPHRENDGMMRIFEITIGDVTLNIR
jgi:hypothetical protein